MARRRLLLADDSDEDRSALRDALTQSRRHTYEFVEAESIEEALINLGAGGFDCVLLDYSFPIGTAFEVLRVINKMPIAERIPVVMITGQGSEAVAVRAMRAGAHDYISKTDLSRGNRAPDKVIERAIIQFGRRREVMLVQEERDRALEALKTAKREAESANVAKSAFLANMSHEIRSPLTAIIGFTELLLAGNLAAEEAERFHATIHRNGKHLLAVINDILDFSKVEAGMIVITRAPFDLHAMIQESAASYRAAMAEKNLKFRVFVHPHLPRFLLSDETRVRQVINNLLSNALKFTLTGEVALIAAGGTGERAGEEISIVVADSGIGVSKSESEKLFSRFVQANPTIGARFGGSGLGLALSRRLAEKLDGGLELVSSECGVGSIFRFTLPWRTAETAKGEPATVAKSDGGGRIDLSGVRIALADDSVDNQELFKRMLEGVGARVETAGDGWELVELIRQRAFDVVLLDVEMPNLDGREAARILRREGFDRPIVGLTAHAFPEDRTRSLAAGFTDQLAKPINVRELVETVRSLL